MNQSRLHISSTCPSRKFEKKIIKKIEVQTLQKSASP